MSSFELVNDFDSKQPNSSSDSYYFLDRMLMSLELAY